MSRTMFVTNYFNGGTDSGDRTYSHKFTRFLLKDRRKVKTELTGKSKEVLLRRDVCSGPPGRLDAQLIGYNSTSMKTIAPSFTTP